MYSQGDIILVPFPFTNLANSKRRPGIVISNDSVNQKDDLLVVMVTSVQKQDDFTFELKNTMLTTPLHKQSEVRCHKIFTLEKSIVVRKISKINHIPMQDLLNQIVETVL